VEATKRKEEKREKPKPDSRNGKAYYFLFNRANISKNILLYIHAEVFVQKISGGHQAGRRKEGKPGFC
jgi:hypothetical protein